MSYENDLDLNDPLNALPFFDRHLGRIFTPDSPENIRRFREDFRASELGSRLKAEGLDHGDNLVLILSTAQTELDKEDVNTSEMSAIGRRLYLLGDLKPKQAPVAQAPAPKQLTEPQKRWSEYRQFSEQANMSEINRRKQSDPGFASYVRKCYEREIDQEIGDAVVNLNQKAPTKKNVPDDVAAYAVRFRTMSTDASRTELSPGRNPLGPAAAAEANRLFELACQYGLI
jgi:hypothetical protein